MRKSLLYGVLLVLAAATVESSATILVDQPPVVDSFCDGYAICR